MNKYSFSSDEFSSRHNSISEKDQMLMLKEIGLKSLDELIRLTLPKSISLEKELNVKSIEIAEGIISFQR